MNQLVRIFATLFILSLFITEILTADWPCRSDTSLPVVTAAGNQWNVRLASDQNHGAILVWQDRRDGSADQLYIQRINYAGIPQWGDNGIRLSESGGYQYYPQIICDGTGGAFITWQDNRSGMDYDIYIQRIDKNGGSLWGTYGIRVCGESGHQYNPQITSDCLGGVIVTWQDRRYGQFDIYAQRYDSTGRAFWPYNGQVVCNEVSNQVDPKIIYDTKGGAIITWADYRAESGTTDIYAQRILSNGQAAWTSNGLPICTASNLQYNAQIIPDTNGGAIIAWQDRRNTNYDNIYAQRIDSYGSIKWQYNGVAIAPVVGAQSYPRVVTDWYSGAVIIWQDNRTGSDYDIYIQRIGKDGIPLWGALGLPVCTSLGHQYNPEIIVHGNQFVVTWQDRRDLNFDIYAQRFNLAGVPQWNHDGNVVAKLPFDQFMPQIVEDSMDGGIIAWADYQLNTGTTDIFCHHIGANGLAAGGCYRTFMQDSLAVKARKVKKYNHLIVAMPNAGNIRDTVFGKGYFPYGITVGINKSDNPKSYGWENFTKQYYVRRALPQTGLPRPFDYRLDKRFVGVLKNPSVSRYNNKLVGEMITLELNIAASDLGITNPNFGDLVFNDATQSTNPLNKKKLRDLVLCVDSMLTFWSKYTHVDYVQICNTIRRINQAFDGPFDTISTSPIKYTATKALFSIPFLQPSSDPPFVLPEYNTEIADEENTTQYQLLQNYPNPFNPFTTIEFILPEPATISLKVYNILGQEVARIFDHEYTEEIHQVVDFDASALPSGVYFYRLIVESSEDGRITSMVKKMMVIK
jgi:Secretion system C-terminal sorting domain